MIRPRSSPKEPTNSDPQGHLYTAAADDGLALHEEATSIYKQLRALRRLTITSRDERRNRRAYRTFLKARLHAIQKAQKALCSQCDGTGDYNDQHSIYRNCPSCDRLNPKYPTHLVSNIWSKRI